MENEREQRNPKIELDRIGRTYSAILGSLLGFTFTVILSVMLGEWNTDHMILAPLFSLWMVGYVYLTYKDRYKMLEVM